MSFWTGLARAFTISAKERAILSANPLEPLVAQVLSQEIQGLAAGAINKRVGDPQVAAALKVGIGQALQLVGLD